MKKKLSQKSASLRKSSGTKDIPQLGDDLDMDHIFQADGKGAPKFSALLEETDPQSWRKALREKQGGRPGKTPLASLLHKAPPAQEELDLHGFTAAEAEQKTAAFIGSAGRRRLQTIKIITGKGLHSPNGPVLKDVVEHRLAELKSSRAILAYMWEKKNKEKSGALIVYLP
jgi:DNA-nicking Smr family endonuclease